jgi:hypothetical protein
MRLTQMPGGLVDFIENIQYSLLFTEADDLFPLVIAQSAVFQHKLLRFSREVGPLVALLKRWQSPIGKERDYGISFFAILDVDGTNHGLNQINEKHWFIAFNTTLNLYLLF